MCYFVVRCNDSVNMLMVLISRYIIVVFILVYLLGYSMLVYTFQMSKCVLMMMCIMLLTHTLGRGIGNSSFLLKLCLYISLKEGDMQP